jgi:hypothetical protein
MAGFQIDGEGRSVIPLAFPVKAHGEEISELRLRRPKAKHLKGLKVRQGAGGTELSMEDMIQLISKLADIPASSADELDMADLQTVGEAIQEMMGESRPAGN